MPDELVHALDVDPHRLDPAVARNIHDPEHIGTSLGRAGDPSAAQRVTREPSRIEPGQLGTTLDDLGHRAVSQALIGERPPLRADLNSGPSVIPETASQAASAALTRVLGPSATGTC